MTFGVGGISVVLWERFTMRTIRIILIAAALTAATQASATIYSDATGDLHNGSPSGTNFTSFTHLDIASVEITNTATDISFAVTFVGDIVATDWGKYMIGIDSTAGGDSGGNGWGRPISMPGIDYWIGSWVDSGNGAELYQWGGASWSRTEASWDVPPNNDISIGKTQFVATITLPLSTLGLSAGNSFRFDAFSSGGGGGDSAVDALSSSVPSITDWGNAFGSPGNSGLRTYTVTAVPEASSLAALSVVASLSAGCGIYARRRRAAA